MPLSFWIKRFLVVFTGAFVILFAVGIARGRPLRQVLLESALWSAIATTLFIATRLYHLSKGRKCAMCQDAPPDTPDSGTDARSKV